MEVVESVLLYEVAEGLNGKDWRVEGSVQDRMTGEVAAGNLYCYVGVDMAGWEGILLVLDLVDMKTVDNQ